MLQRSILSFVTLTAHSNMRCIRYFLTFAGVTLMLLRVCESTPCSDVVLKSYEYTSPGCDGHLDCSEQAKHKRRLEDTLLNSAEIKQCVQSKTGQYFPWSIPHCPPSGDYRSGVSYSDVPTRTGLCSFCFKIVIVRLKLGAFGKPCTMGRKRRQVNVSEYNINYIISTYAEIPVEKIGPGPVNVTFTEENVTETESGIAKSQILSFAEVYQNTTVLVGPIPQDGFIRVKLSHATNGCIGNPSMIEVRDPTSTTTNAPTSQPTSAPTSQPTSAPTSQPTSAPTSQPTSASTSQPTSAPPTFQPTSQPTSAPTSQPTSAPTSQPTSAPTSQPTSAPTSQPTSASTSQPTSAPPTFQPTTAPTSQPTSDPTSQPTSASTYQPTYAPTSQPTSAPTSQPTSAPTSQPTSTPTSQPTSASMYQPTYAPTSQPTSVPTGEPENETTTGPAN
ncbi:uncharacterized protein [Amphiura filiformis]|uniref:uncharacterized protein n=1 Tax=Amphiura filiformis TaxID=82378 RepID=UPI003B210D25